MTNAGRSVGAACAALAFVSGCVATSAPEKREPAVPVYQTPWRPEGVVGMPAGCRMLAEGPPQLWSETDLVSADTFRSDRNRAAALGANALLLVEKLVRPREDFDCAAAQPIGDCPKTLGAWYQVTVRAYVCDGAGRQALAAGAPSPGAAAEPR